MSYTPEDDEKVKQLIALLEKRSARPGLAKVDPSDRGRMAFHKLFVAGVNALLEERDDDGKTKWSLSSLAGYVGVNRSTFNTWYNWGYQKRNQIPGWVASALPRPARPEMARALLEWSEPPPPSRTGTDDA